MLDDPLHDADGVQATVARWDAGGGAVVLDDGRELPVPPAAFLPPVRSLRPGQRVHLRVRAGRASAVTLWTLPLP